MTSQIEILLSQSQAEILKKHSRESAPNESCAILFGDIESEKYIVKEIFLTENTESSPVTFTISNEDLIKAYNHAEKNSLDISGIFHSHPNSVAYPSETDKKYMEVNPVPWIIFSNLNDEFRAYIYDSGILPVAIKIS